MTDSTSMLIDEVTRLRKAIKDLIFQAEEAAGELEHVGLARAADTLYDAAQDAQEAING